MEAIKTRCSFARLVNIEELLPHPKNPNKHTDAQIDRLAKIIAYQGIRHPVTVSTLSGYIITGHATLMAFGKLGLKQVPVDYQEFDDDAQEYAHLVADNAIAEFWAETDLAMVNHEFTEYGPDFDTEWLGIKDFNIVPTDALLPELNSTDPSCQSVTFILSTEQKDILDEAMNKASKNEMIDDGINKNKNGNILAAILKRYVYS